MTRFKRISVSRSVLAVLLLLVGACAVVACVYLETGLSWALLAAGVFALAGGFMLELDD